MKLLIVPTCLSVSQSVYLSFYHQVPALWFPPEKELLVCKTEFRKQCKVSEMEITFCEMVRVDVLFKSTVPKIEGVLSFVGMYIGPTYCLSVHPWNLPSAAVD